MELPQIFRLSVEKGVPLSAVRRWANRSCRRRKLGAEPMSGRQPTNDSAYCNPAPPWISSAASGLRKSNMRRWSSCASLVRSTTVSQFRPATALGIKRCCHSTPTIKPPSSFCLWCLPSRAFHHASRPAGCVTTIHASPDILPDPSSLLSLAAALRLLQL